MLEEHIQLTGEDRRVAVGVREETGVYRIEHGYGPVSRARIRDPHRAPITVTAGARARELRAASYRVAMNEGCGASSGNVHARDRTGFGVRTRRERIGCRRGLSGSQHKRGLKYSQAHGHYSDPAYGAAISNVEQ